MTFGICRGIATDLTGNVVPNVRVEVRRMVPGFPLAAPIYADADGATGLDNYFVSASGEWEFYAVGGLYRVRVFTVGGGYDKTWDNVAVGTAQAADVDHYAQAGFTWAPESATTSPPTAGCIRFDNADVSAATHAYISKDTLGGSDATNWLTAFLANDWLLAATGVGIEVGWPVVSITNNTSWFDFELGTYAGPAGPLSFGDSGFVSVAREKAPNFGSVIDTDGTLAANSDVKVASQKAVKTYVNAAIAGVLDGVSAAYDTLAEIAADLVQKIAGSIGGADNALLRADGAGGKTLQATGIAVDDSNNMTGVAGLAATGLVDLSGASAGQVKFPATQNPSADANTLDDYEEGTWTPTVAFGGNSVGVTYGALTKARYTKIGRVVVVDFNIVLTSKGTSTGSATIEGLPFGPLPNDGFYTAASFGIALNMASITGGVAGLAQPNSSRVLLYHTNNGSSAALTNANFTNTTNLYGSVSYCGA